MGSTMSDISVDETRRAIPGDFLARLVTCKHFLRAHINGNSLCVDIQLWGRNRQDVLSDIDSIIEGYMSQSSNPVPCVSYRVEREDYADFGVLINRRLAAGALDSDPSIVVFCIEECNSNHYRVVCMCKREISIGTLSDRIMEMTGVPSSYKDFISLEVILDPTDIFKRLLKRTTPPMVYGNGRDKDTHNFTGQDWILKSLNPATKARSEDENKEHNLPQTAAVTKQQQEETPHKDTGQPESAHFESAASSVSILTALNSSHAKPSAESNGCTQREECEGQKDSGMECNTGEGFDGDHGNSEGSRDCISLMRVTGPQLSQAPGDECDVQPDRHLCKETDSRGTQIEGMCGEGRENTAIEKYVADAADTR